MAKNELVKRSTTSSETTRSSAKNQEIAALTQDVGRFSMIRNFHLADAITLGNGVCGALSLFNSANYMLTNDRYYLWWAVVLPAAGFAFDVLDGRVARMRRTSSILGQELDSLADSVRVSLHLS